MHRSSRVQLSGGREPIVVGGGGGRCSTGRVRLPGTIVWGVASGMTSTKGWILNVDAVVRGKYQMHDHKTSGPVCFELCPQNAAEVLSSFEGQQVSYIIEIAAEIQSLLHNVDCLTSKPDCLDCDDCAAGRQHHCKRAAMILCCKNSGMMCRAQAWALSMVPREFPQVRARGCHLLACFVACLLALRKLLAWP